MGSNGGASAEEIFGDSSSQPLLGKSSTQEQQQYESEASAPIGYNHGPRYFKDVAFLLIFAVLVLATFAFGIFAIAHHNSNYSSVGSYVYDRNSSVCARSSLGAENINDGQLVLQMALNVASDPLGYHHHLKQVNTMGSGRHLVKDLVWTLVITLILSLPFVSGLLWLLRTYTKQIVYACLPFFVLIPAFINVFWFVACAVSKDCRESVNLALRIFIFLFIFVLCGIIVWVIYANWHRIELTIRIIRTASEGLRRNMGLLLVLPSLMVVLFVYFVPNVVFLSFARLNGKIIPNPKVEESGYPCGGSTGVECCVWKEDRWVPAYYALAIITMIWSATAMVEAQLYIISATVAQWYFAKAGSAPTRSIRNSVRNAFGPSFGTVCFSGLVFGAVRIVRAAVDNARREGQEGIVFVVLRCCVDCMLSAIEFLNKFTINFAAITGESFCSSARMSYELLKRNLLSAVVVEAISTRILFGIIFVLSVIYGIVVCAILKAGTSLGGDAYLVTVLAWVLLFLILFFFVHILDNVIDTVYICYAMDKDRGDVSKPEVHDVYILLPVSRNDTSVLAIHRR